jgi:hypothetical protein
MNINIKNETLLSSENVFDYVSQVIKMGKISQNETCYCYLVTFKYSNKRAIYVSCRKTRKSYIFNVQMYETK